MAPGCPQRLLLPVLFPANYNMHDWHHLDVQMALSSWSEEHFVPFVYLTMWREEMRFQYKVLYIFYFKSELMFIKHFCFFFIVYRKINLKNVVCGSWAISWFYGFSTFCRKLCFIFTLLLFNFFVFFFLLHWRLKFLVLRVFLQWSFLLTEEKKCWVCC